MTYMKTIQQAQVKSKNVLIRIDADVPMAKEWTDGNTREIIDDGRLRASIPTIKFLLEKGAQKITIMGHADQPEGIDFNYSLWPVANRLAELLGFEQRFFKPQLNFPIDEKIIIYENMRFDPREEKNDPTLAQDLAKGQDIFVQDAFATAHRAHASTVGVAKLLPSYAGMSVQKEVENLKEILASPKEGFTIIIGGKKAEDKLPMIENLFDKAENFLVGGIVGSTFLAAKGVNLGKSLVEKEILAQAKEILEKFEKNNKNILLPVDLLLSKSVEKPLEIKHESIESLGDVADYFVVDIGVETAANFIYTINNSSTIFWNGNMGVSEVEEFRKSTWKIAEAIANSNSRKYAGGGDTTAFIRKMGIAENFDFVSNAGGATLEFLAGKTLSGLEVLE